jgi:hypothetical protein
MLACDRQQIDHLLKVGLDQLHQIGGGRIRKSEGDLPSA